MQTRVKIACVYGGDGKSYQIRQLKFGEYFLFLYRKYLQFAGVDIIIATPGRLTDLHSMGFVDFSQVFYVVLDEADRMLDMGFEPQIRAIFELV